MVTSMAKVTNTKKVMLMAKDTTMVTKPKTDMDVRPVRQGKPEAPHGAIAVMSDTLMARR